MQFSILLDIENIRPLMILKDSVISPHTLSFVILPICYLLPLSWVLKHSIISPSLLYYFLSKTFSCPRSKVLRLYFLVSLDLIRLVHHRRNHTVRGTLLWDHSLSSWWPGVSLGGKYLYLSQGMLPWGSSWSSG